MNVDPKPLWKPHAAGALLGLGLLLTFVVTGHGLGGSGFTTALSAAGADLVAPAATAANAYLGPMVADDSNPLDAWITWQVLGVAIGALIGASRRGASVSASMARRDCPLPVVCRWHCWVESLPDSARAFPWAAPAAWGYPGQPPWLPLVSSFSAGSSSPAPYLVC